MPIICGVVLVLVWLGIMSLVLLCRFLRCYCGKRLEANGRKALLITGSTSGIGLTLAKYYYKLGFSVLATYYSEQEPGFQELSQLARTQNPQEPHQSQSSCYLFLLPMDVRSQQSIQDCWCQVEQLIINHRFELFCLLNNAGTATDASFECTDATGIQNTLETNLLGAMLVTKRFLYPIIKNKGRVVNVSSAIQSVPCGFVSVYGATKAGLRYFTQVLDIELRKYGASASCVMPGNLIASTNIIYTRIKTTQRVVSNMTQDERKLYDGSIKREYRMYASLLKSRSTEPRHKDQNHNQHMLSTTGNLKLMDPKLVEIFEGSRQQINKSSILAVGMRRITQLISGGSFQRNIDCSSAIEAFDCAIRLENSPTLLYAGNLFFAYVTGPIVDLFIPPALISIMSPNLHKLVRFL